MNYKETLNKAKENGIEVLKLNVAFEVSEEIENLDDGQFEKVCNLVERAYLKSESVEVWAICQAIKEMIARGAKIDRIDVWDLIFKASDY